MSRSTGATPDRVVVGPGQTGHGANPRFSWRKTITPGGVLALFVGAFGVLFGLLTWAQQSNFGTFDYDVGVFDQEIWLAAHHLNPFLSIRGLNMWANHVNPIIYALVPFYWLGAGPHFLFVVQILSFVAAAVALWKLAAERWQSEWAALAIAFSWLMYPAVEWMTIWSFHPEYIGIPFFILAYYFSRHRRWGWYAACVVVVLLCKEDTALAVMALGVLLVFRRQWREGWLTILGAGALLLFNVELLMPLATGTSAPFYFYGYSELGSSAFGVVWNSILHPLRVVSLVFHSDRWPYYWDLLAPVGALAFLAPGVLFLALPTTLENVLNNQGYPYNFRYQYSAYVTVGIFLALIEGIARFRHGRAMKARAIVIGTLCVVSLIGNATLSPSPLDQRVYTSGIWALQSDTHLKTLAAMVDQVPASAGVAATYMVVPHLSHRDQIYTWPNPWIRSYYGVDATNPPEYPSSVQYLVLDLNQVLGGSSANLLTELTGPGGPFKVLESRHGALLAKRVKSHSKL